jgi:hypothetical protein
VTLRWIVKGLLTTIVELMGTTIVSPPVPAAQPPTFFLVLTALIACARLQLPLTVMVAASAVLD